MCQLFYHEGADVYHDCWSKTVEDQIQTMNASHSDRLTDTDRPNDAYEHQRPDRRNHEDGQYGAGNYARQRAKNDGHHDLKTEDVKTCILEVYHRGVVRFHVVEEWFHVQNVLQPLPHALLQVFRVDVHWIS